MREILGMSYRLAKEYLECRGYRMRIVFKNRRPMVVSSNYQRNIIDVAIDEGIVTKIMNPEDYQFTKKLKWWNA